MRSEYSHVACWGCGKWLDGSIQDMRSGAYACSQRCLSIYEMRNKIHPLAMLRIYGADKPPIMAEERKTS